MRLRGKTGRPDLIFGSRGDTDGACRPAAVALRHVAFEDLGLLAPILEQFGWRTSYCDVSIEDLSNPAIASADLLIVLGGPIGVYDTAFPFLSQEVQLLERRLARGRPTLGICLGSQLMASALGSRVFAGAHKEIGWGRVTLTDEGASSCLAPLADSDAVVLHWHGDTFDLPGGAARLASSDLYDNQAFAYGQRALALQFHVEADPRSLEEWYVGHSVELAAAGISIADLRSATAKVADQSRMQAKQIFSTWLRQIVQFVDRAAATSTGSTR
jgi:GMP synthase (glutamine-hydrolysing)